MSYLHCVNVTQYDNNSIESDDNTEIPENYNYAKLHPVSTNSSTDIDASSSSTKALQLLGVQSYKSVEATTSTATKTKTSSCTATVTSCDLPSGYETEWEIILIRIAPTNPSSSSSLSSSSSKLGCVITRDNFHATCNSNSNNADTSTDINHSKKKKLPHCRVRNLVENGLGIQCGLKVDDWFLCPMTAAMQRQRWSMQ
ncbi:hypothetical protein FRACYDRAFT_256695 [Fragilariopsis cylindrus CCMP1102]|uniref:Uncharacterized protein n=1 Tax=Fragilariopsis cylindrus CCMP1102 TaxID=635003 RepID=A0A1E7EJK3_9STRA|nr:hypothetical protein FRACYDRAFT_256695 [Fragilariopsis cylindrus CCMP1102]|eukprot:OEU06050.1 hypothetical protein FRACYDRAFT_256695 [Fragilariopsis cylindrus CCMP1102]